MFPQKLSIFSSLHRLCVSDDLFSSPLSMRAIRFFWKMICLMIYSLCLLTAFLQLSQQLAFSSSSSKIPWSFAFALQLELLWLCVGHARVWPMAQCGRLDWLLPVQCEGMKSWVHSPVEWIPNRADLQKAQKKFNGRFIWNCFLFYCLFYCFFKGKTWLIANPSI